MIVENDRLRVVLKIGFSAYFFIFNKLIFLQKNGIIKIIIIIKLTSFIKINKIEKDNYEKNS